MKELSSKPKKLTFKTFIFIFRNFLTDNDLNILSRCGTYELNISNTFSIILTIYLGKIKYYDYKLI